ncbi:Dyp-type peroxidase [Erwiniaceae bacterium BAC15a-03b]|uniref:Dyp-type peroxidase n=1 Tax=Winslowiella arboricola TaxID=2978220 RepID=A0A9J6PNJ9_9GAMM|nr:Dyp-type peroxidase [Winslowiella arboricola]MCU5771096.1 Dyp-type peroxidase [Winslowiella arboricola]MCU5777216.1 Dyp-type peroxidase [Winslowiella arboricola]
MSQFQSGILLEHRRFAIYLEASVQGDIDAIRSGSQQFLQQLNRLQQQFPDAGLGAVLAFGDALWRDLSAGQGAAELKAFQPLGKGIAPATQRDLLIHIQSLRHDVNFSLAQAALAAFGGAITVEDETHGFRWVEDRDLSGFVDGTENPQGEKRQQVAIIADGSDRGGSYVFTQRWQHNLKQWQRLDVSKQEQVMGRTKVSNEELDSASRPATSHISRVDLKENGQGLKILRQSLPYGTVSGNNGLFFIAYCATLYNIEQQLLSMFGEHDGKFDAMLRFTKPVSGSYFFAPSLDQLLAL